MTGLWRAGQTAPLVARFRCRINPFDAVHVSQAFQKHIKAFHESDAFKAKAKEAAPFFHDVKDFVFGRPATLENIVRILPDLFQFRSFIRPSSGMSVEPVTLIRA
jgi:hypothetical protein